MTTPKDAPVRKKYRKVRKDSKYDQKYARQLHNGIRYKEGLSVMELCHKWHISKDTYYDWTHRHEEFMEAHKIGQTGYAAWLHEQYKGIMSGEIKGHGGCVMFAMKNVEGIEWKDKVEVNNTGEQEVKRIVIEVLPTRQEALEHQDSGEIVDAEIIEKLECQQK